MDDIIMTQLDMCNMSDTNRATMSRYLNGKKNPKLITAKRIAEACNVPMDIFLSVETQKTFFGKSFLKEDIDYNKKQRE